MRDGLSNVMKVEEETWFRLSRADTSDVDNLRGWLTTVTARVCLDMLRSRKARLEDPGGVDVAADQPAPAADAEQEAVLADSVGLALLVVLEKLEPAERLAFVLHDLFAVAVAFEEIAPIVGRSEVATRQLASRARRRVRGAPEGDEANLARQRDVIDKLLAALRSGDVEAVVSVLDPNVVVHAQSPNGTVREIRGARTWARSAVAFSRALEGVQPALVDGALGAIHAPRGKLRSALRVTFEGEKIARVDIVTGAAALRSLEIAPLD